MHLAKQILFALAMLLGLALIVWLKYHQIKDNTIFSNDKGPQTLFKNDEDP